MERATDLSTRPFGLGLIVVLSAGIGGMLPQLWEALGKKRKST